jgi:uncharacterized phiE125 gp8 family phage protein
VALKVLTAATVEPVSLSDMKLHLRVDHSTDDSLISALISGARDYVERQTRRTLVHTTYRQTMDWFPDGPIELLRSPASTTAVGGSYSYAMPRIRYYDINGDLQTLTHAGGDFELDLDNNPPRLQLTPMDTWPNTENGKANAVEVDYVAGFGATAASVPALLVQCIKLLVGHWYENRSAVQPGFGGEVPLAVDSILKIYSAGDYQ